MADPTTESVVEAKATCMTCGGVTAAIAAEADFVEWFTYGEYIQVAMAHETTWTREVFLGWRSGAFICEACTASMEAAEEG
jgi:hypothetical protein